MDGHNKTGFMEAWLRRKKNERNKNVNDEKTNNNVLMHSNLDITPV